MPDDYTYTARGNGPPSTYNPQTNPALATPGGNQFDWSSFNANIAANPSQYAGTSWDPAARVVPYMQTQRGDNTGSAPNMDEARQRDEAARQAAINQQYQGGYLKSNLATLLSGNPNMSFSDAVSHYSQPYYGNLSQTPEFQQGISEFRSTYDPWRQANPTAALGGYGNAVPSGAGQQQTTYAYNPNANAMELAWTAGPSAPGVPAGVGQGAVPATGGQQQQQSTMGPVATAPDVQQGATPSNPNQPYVGGGNQQTVDLAGMTPRASATYGAAANRRKTTQDQMPWYL